MWDQRQFIDRLMQLQEESQLSSQKLSYHLGHGPSYINNIINGKNLPTMKNFFEMCDFFKITPGIFFSPEETAPIHSQKLIRVSRDLRADQLDHLIAIMEDLGRCQP